MTPTVTPAVIFFLFWIFFFIGYVRTEKTYALDILLDILATEILLFASLIIGYQGGGLLIKLLGLEIVRGAAFCFVTYTSVQWAFKRLYK